MREAERVGAVGRGKHARGGARSRPARPGPPRCQAAGCGAGIWRTEGDDGRPTVDADPADTGALSPQPGGWQRPLSGAHQAFLILKKIVRHITANQESNVE